MRNPILQQEAPNMCTSDLKMLHRNAKKQEGRLLDQIELNRDTIIILEQELQKR